MTDKYNDIIDLPRPTSKSRYPMPIIERAAQFSPFAALTGHDEVVKETARLTEDRIELDEYLKDVINDRLQILIRELGNLPITKITYFRPDQNKDGGAYLTVEKAVKKIDEYERLIYMEDDIIIPIEEIIRIDGKIFGTNPP